LQPTVSAQNDVGDALSYTYTDGESAIWQVVMVYDCVDTTYLDGITLTWTQNYPINLNSEPSVVLEYDFANGPLIYYLWVHNHPVCDSYSSSMLTFDATLTDMNGVSHPFATSGTGNALFIDSTTGQV
jgi:hypothetical protein